MPEEYLGRVIELCEANRGEQKSLEFFHATQVILQYHIPTAQLVDDLFGKLKSVTYVPPMPRFSNVTNRLL
jgi:translation elongation factor EF-4